MFTAKFFVYALLVSCVFGFHKKVIGGYKTPPGKFPYQVSLQKENEHHLCGGSIITNRHILSAAHCFFRIKHTISALAGTSNYLDNVNGVRYQIRKIKIHKKYHPMYLLNDIALLETEREISFTQYIAPIALDRDDVGADVDVILTGWGFTQSQSQGSASVYLNFVRLKTITNGECEKASSLTSNFPITKGHICTLTKQGEGSCYGDSGGGLVNVEINKLIGIVSRGLVKGKCAVGFPDVFIRVSAYVDWIEENMT